MKLIRNALDIYEQSRPFNRRWRLASAYLCRNLQAFLDEAADWLRRVANRISPDKRFIHRTSSPPIKPAVPKCASSMRRTTKTRPIWFPKLCERSLPRHRIDDAGKSALPGYIGHGSVVVLSCVIE
jgi:hypothetical protein